MGLITKHQLASQPDMNPDGTPRHKYEPEHTTENKVARQTVIGLLLATAFVFIKDVLIDGQKSEAQTKGAAIREQKQGPVGDAEPLQDVAENANPAQKDAPERLGSGTSYFGREAALFAGLHEDLAPVHHGGPMPVNDNEALYGAVPGQGVALFPRGGDHTPGDGGGSGGGSSGDDDDSSGDGGSCDDDEDDDDDDAGGGGDDDDDDDDDTNTGVNRLPLVLAPVVLDSLLANRALAIEQNALLKNASDPDGDTLTVQHLRASSGTLVQDAHGGWLFTPELDDTSNVTFTYLISDGQGTTVQTASLDLIAQPNPPTTSGTPSDDRIVGTPNDDIIDALAGNDVVIGREGDDVLLGGEGNDRILAGEGNDVVHAGSGNDVVFSGPGDDVVTGDDGDDIVFGDEGADKLSGDAGNDTILGGEGDDVVSGGTGNDVLRGNEGNDFIDGGAGEDDIEGGSGNDMVLAGLDSDTVSLGSGDDTIVAAAGDGDDDYDGGSGSDTYDISSTTADALIDLIEGQATSIQIGSDLIESIENINGGHGNDIFIANSVTNVFIGGDGDDVFVFRSSADIGNGPGSRDKILDFRVGDRIDLDDVRDEFVDSIEQTFDDKSIVRFTLIQNQEEFQHPGEIKLRYDVLDGNAITILEGNIDHDADAEFQLELAGTYTLTDDDFHHSG
jgi:Ca2+-binding RTX toxin-like protein